MFYTYVKLHEIIFTHTVLMVHPYKSLNLDKCKHTSCSTLLWYFIFKQFQMNVTGDSIFWAITDEVASKKLNEWAENLGKIWSNAKRHTHGNFLFELLQEKKGDAGGSTWLNFHQDNARTCNLSTRFSEIERKRLRKSNYETCVFFIEKA